MTKNLAACSRSGKRCKYSWRQRSAISAARSVGATAQQLPPKPAPKADAAMAPSSIPAGGSHSVSGTVLHKWVQVSAWDRATSVDRAEWSLREKAELGARGGRLWVTGALYTGGGGVGVP
eukprot:scaffold1522_cov101-Isochrysis_galbana.AAC.2